MSNKRKREHVGRERRKATGGSVPKSPAHFYYEDGCMRQNGQTRTLKPRVNVTPHASLVPLSRTLSLPGAFACSDESASTPSITTPRTAHHKATHRTSHVTSHAPISMLTLLISANAHSARPCSCATDRSASTRQAHIHNTQTPREKQSTLHGDP